MTKSSGGLSSIYV